MTLSGLRRNLINGASTFDGLKEITPTRKIYYDTKSNVIVKAPKISLDFPRRTKKLKIYSSTRMEP